MDQDQRAERKERIRALAKDHSYRWRAYMSSALTGLSSADYTALIDLMEDLYLEVFHPLDVGLYLPHLWSSPGHDSGITPEDVNLIDRLRIAEADFMVLCANHPSFGVGQEFEIAQAMGLPIVMFHHESKRVSRMLLGGSGIHVQTGGDATAPSTSVLTYSAFDDVSAALRSRVFELLELLGRIERAEVNVVFGPRLADVVRRNGVDADELAGRTGMPLAFVRHLLSTEESVRAVPRRFEMPNVSETFAVAKFVNPGLWVLQKLCRALGVGIEELVEVRPTAAQALADAAQTKMDREIFLFLTRRDKVNLFEPMKREIVGAHVLAARSRNSAAELDAFLVEILSKVEAELAGH